MTVRPSHSTLSSRTRAAQEYRQSRTRDCRAGALELTLSGNTHYRMGAGLRFLLLISADPTKAPISGPCRTTSAIANPKHTAHWGLPGLGSRDCGSELDELEA